MSSNIVTAITLYGNLNDEPDIWFDWYEFSKELIKQFGYLPNFVSIKSDTIEAKKIRNLKRMDNKILTLFKSKESINRLAILSLPPAFSSASFDYDVYLSRSLEHLTLITHRNVFQNYVDDKIINSLKQFLEFSNGEIYSMDRYESPLIYALKANPASSFKTLEIIQQV